MRTRQCADSNNATRPPCNPTPPPPTHTHAAQEFVAAWRKHEGETLKEKDVELFDLKFPVGCCEGLHVCVCVCVHTHTHMCCWRARRTQLWRSNLLLTPFSRGVCAPRCRNHSPPPPHHPQMSTNAEFVGYGEWRNMK
jgi:hypothetical protein